ncbi:MAG: riboflavin synthase [Elusimicrobiota bacterium]|jgi:riboflavin synthase|nr:riboflavin synthase [Elusimicrobiota bacterium]
MFTGLVEDLGSIIEKGKNFILVNSKLIDIKLGDSLAVNGICLSVVKINESIKNTKNFKLEITPETFSRTTLKNIKKREKVNLERAMLMNDRFNGHIVQGHVDGIAKLTNITIKDNSKILKFYVKDKNLLDNIIEKGSISVDGISLTIAKNFLNGFTVSIIPETWENTNLQFKKIGNFFNIETDIITKKSNNKINDDQSLKNLLKKEGFFYL